MSRTNQDPTAGMSEAEVAAYYNEHGVEDFDGGEEIELTPSRRDVVVSVRFTEQEIADVRARAEEAGVKPTAFIRGAVLREGADSMPRLIAALGAARADIDRALREAKIGA